jgi:ribosomal protein S18 acetylase RimI-like enzyme
MDIIYDEPSIDEFKFVLDSWSNSFRKSPYAGVVPNNMWAEVSRSSMTQLMTRATSSTVVALTPVTKYGEFRKMEAPVEFDLDRGRVMGYSVSEPGILHWLYVKKDYRRLGIGKQLLQNLVSKWDDNSRKHPRYTHKTDSSQRFLPPGWKWDVIPARVKG